MCLVIHIYYQDSISTSTFALAHWRDPCYTIRIHCRGIMHDYDSEFVFDYDNSCHDWLEESYSHEKYSYDMDEDYNRVTDSQDYQQLAYIHFAWYTTIWIQYVILVYYD